MKSDVIMINNQGSGFQEAVDMTKKIAEYKSLNHQDSLHLQLFTEEMLSMIHSITGEVKASFWIECEGDLFDLHLSTKTIMDQEKRQLLLSSASSRKNEAAKSFLGKLRDAFEKAMASEVDRQYFELPPNILVDLTNRVIADPEWDGYERSVLLTLADDVKIGIRGGVVDMTVSKKFA